MGRISWAEFKTSSDDADPSLRSPETRIPSDLDATALTSVTYTLKRLSLHDFVLNCFGNVGSGFPSQSTSSSRERKLKLGIASCMSKCAFCRFPPSLSLILVHILPGLPRVLQLSPSRPIHSSKAMLLPSVFQLVALAVDWLNSHGSDQEGFSAA